MARISPKFIIGTCSAGALGGVTYLVSVLANKEEDLKSYFSRNKLKLREGGWDVVATAYALDADDENLQMEGNYNIDEKYAQ